MIKLKNCPCCGSMANLIKTRKRLDEEDEYDSCKVECSKCGMQSGSYVNNIEKPVEIWNRRDKLIEDSKNG